MLSIKLQRISNKIYVYANFGLACFICVLTECPANKYWLIRLIEIVSIQSNSILWEFIIFVYKILHFNSMADIRDKEEDVDSGDDEDYDPEAPVVGDWKKVDLPEVPVVTGE